MLVKNSEIQLFIYLFFIFLLICEQEIEKLERKNDKNLVFKP